MEGVLAELNEKLNMPDKLYITGDFAVQFYKNGDIKEINAFLYGDSRKGKKQTYLINYDVTQNEEVINVWTDGEANADYNEDKALDPMLAILQQVDLKKQVTEWSSNLDTEVYEIVYSGKRNFNTQEGLVFIPGDVDGDRIVGDSSNINKLSSGGLISGYEVSLHVPFEDKTVPMRYIIEPEYISQEVVIEQNLSEQEKKAKTTKGWTIDKNNGTVYFFLEDNNTIGWKLEVVDSALGSRFYELKYTENGGVSWEIKNEHPFSGKGGVAEGIEFFDESYGYIGIAGASGDYSEIFVTRDGGISFTEIILPMNTVTSLPKSAKEYGLSIDDYKYISMPEYENEILTVKVKSNSVEKEGIIFESQDRGANWKFKE
ncbi:hypothetical protein SAMN02745245_00369 [Anaerosphaera aminiphila DSM 21120]|uniref:Uncharacterized protein n=1 Tax=Anaerosphaera aminiphila DSM 21120 TaxID=1120995 RepID=A0A1M5PKP7_9FIRM|nr:hypothetical protein SAMN02745245_00369 [Anaerosphaera aminiphila DSM 21120]